jgi:hypothetical protein
MTRWGKLGLVATMGLGAVLALPGCVSAADTQPPQATANTDNAKCDVLTATQISSVVTPTFQEGRLLPSSTDTRFECQYSGESEIAVVKTVTDATPNSYAKARAEFAQSIGAQDVKVSSADMAFQSPAFGLTGMQVDGEYVEVSVTVNRATAAQVQEIAEIAAANVS